MTGRLYVGSISGTSVDGLDLALLEVDDPLCLRGAKTLDMPGALRGTLLALGQPGKDDIDTLGRARLDFACDSRLVIDMPMLHGGLCGL